MVKKHEHQILVELPMEPPAMLPPAARMVVLVDAVHGDESLQCSVCISEFVKGERVQQSACGHSFHQACIGPWVETHVTCPMCRAVIVVE